MKNRKRIMAAGLAAALACGPVLNAGAAVPSYSLSEKEDSGKEAAKEAVKAAVDEEANMAASAEANAFVNTAASVAASAAASTAVNMAARTSANTAASAAANAAVNAVSQAVDVQGERKEKGSSISPVCDETLYVTMNPYGVIQESSVVKSYATNGNTRIMDYGSYNSVKNMTDHGQPVMDGDGKVTFNLEKPTDRFYFEGSTKTSKADLPWDVQVSYRLNGLDKSAAELSGAKGLVEVNVDLVPNKRVSEYDRDNMVLIAGAVVDMDKNLSLEADGAQIQVLGNMNAVIFFALPGEERHYSIRIGSDDFTFGGLAFTMTPLKAAQLDKLGDLREAKTTLEDSGNAVNASLDVLLNTLKGMEKSVSDTADGLRGLDHSRQLFADSKGKVYADADAALDGLKDLSNQFKPFSGHMEEAQKFLDTMNSHVNELTSHLDDLSPDLDNMKETLRDLRDDLRSLSSALNAPQVDLGARAFLQLMEKTKADLEILKQSQAKLDGGVSALAPALAGLIGSSKGLGKSREENFGIDSINGLLEEMKAAGVDMGDSDEVASYLRNEVGLATDQIDALMVLISSTLYPKATPSQAAAGNISAAVNAIVTGFHGTAGNTGLTGDLQAAIGQLEALLAAVAAQKPSATGILTNTADAAHLAASMCSTLDETISVADSFTRTVNYYHDDGIKVLHDVGRLTDSAGEALDSLVVFSHSFENQLKAVGDSLNDGTKKTLNGLAGTLDQMGTGMSQTETLKNAKDTIKSLIDNKWDEYTKKDTTILNADKDAKPASLTSDKNPSPRTVQIILRTEEIKEADKKASKEVDESYHADGGVVHRIANIFRQIWKKIAAVAGK